MKSLLGILCLAALSFTPYTRAADLPTKMDLASARVDPFTLIGQLYFTSGRFDYLGSGVVIRPKSVLTAGHNLYDRDAGWSWALEMRRGAYGKEVLSKQFATRMFLVSGYRARANFYGGDSRNSFALDMGGLRFPKVVAGGAAAGWTTESSLITDTTAQKTIIGYGAEGANKGDFPLRVSTQRAFTQVQGAFLEANQVYFEGGMSGGPVFATDSAGDLVVTGIVVSASDAPLRGGVRVLNKKAANLIQKYLR